MEVRPDKVGLLLIDLTERGLSPQLEVVEDLPLGRKRGAVTTEEIVQMAFAQQRQLSTTQLTKAASVYGKGKASVHLVLNKMKKDGLVKNPSQGHWERIA